jgi:hypothetical protein
MKAISVLLMLVVTAVCQTAQTLPRSPASSDVAILEFNWHKNFHRPNWDRQGTAYRMTRGIMTGKLEELVKEYVYRVTIQNNSSKTITAIVWDYVFIDPDTQKEMARHAFQSNERILPGKKRSLIGSTTSPQTQVINAKAAEQNSRRPLEEKVIVRSILYLDKPGGRQP